LLILLNVKPLYINKENLEPMKANVKAKDHAFNFIVPMTMAIVIGISTLVIGSFVIGEISTALEGSLPVAASRSTNQNRTVSLIGNLTESFEDIVDIEVVVIIITALSMAILAIMSVGTRPRF
jgi:heme/copper-type cytochrome/quinol oxidase subunit 2